ncbi:MAG: peptidase M14 family protein [Gemmatimonadetes bacterium]|nr:peptidase M14 family protein [Gemmatimonadota bacterium]
MKAYLPFRRLFLVLLTLTFCFPAWTAAQQIPSPEQFFGHQMGADRQLARWDKLVEYYDMIGERSDRVQVVHMGPSTLGNPFLSIFVSSPENLANLDEIKRMNAILQDPREHSQAEIDNAIENSKVVFVQSYGLHSTEVAGSQSAAEVMYDFATRDDDGINEILDNTVSILIPAFNPDGNIIVTDWYNRWVGTEYEGSGPPELYHHFIGHDNNRDAFMQNTIESYYGAEILFREWVPQAYIDHHQMGPYTARIYLPPYAEPIRPEGDPLVWREMAWYGAHMAYKMEEAELDGAIGAAIYSGWGHFGFHWITPFHNIAGMLTESASARLATPLYVHPDQLGGSRQLPEYAEQTTFPSPWPGGWWHVRDIVDRQIIATFSPLELAAKNRETVLRNAYNKASRQTRRGMEGATKAYVISADQHDPLTMMKMVNKLLLQGITVERSDVGFTHERYVYDAGSYVVSMAQPKRGLIRWLLGQTYYPDNSFTRDRDGSPIRPYDMSGDVISEFMGVDVDPVGTAIEAPLTVVRDLVEPRGEVSLGQHGYVIDGALNDAFTAVNLLFDAGANVWRVDQDGAGVKAGDFIVGAGTAAATIREIATETGVDFMSLDTDASGVSHPLSRQRIGMYQRYYGGNMDEGWTRLLLEDFEFEYTSLFDRHILEGDLHEKWDVIVLPADSKDMMTGMREGGGGRGGDPNQTPPEYRSGFGQAGIDELEAFVENGGTLVTFAQAGDLPIDEFELPIRNAVAGMWGNEFWAPGSTLKVDVDTSSPFAYGMPENALATYLAGGQVYETVAGARSSDVHRIVTYIDRDILQSGWLLGEEAIADKAAVVSVEHGEGTVLLIGFRAQHRAQTHGTFKLFFNALVNGRIHVGVAAAG